MKDKTLIPPTPPKQDEAKKLLADKTKCQTNGNVVKK